MRYTEDDGMHVVKESVVASSRDGKSRRRFAGGTHVALADAHEYGLINDKPSVGVRPAGETPATGSDDPIEYAERSDGAAPENRMESVPENRSEPLDPLGELTDEDYQDLTPAEKGKRTKAANEAKAES